MTVSSSKNVFWIVPLSLAGLCESFSPMFYKSNTHSVSEKMQKPTAQTWAPTVPKVVDLSQGAHVSERGVQKCEFEKFFAKIEQFHYHEYMWELIDNNVLIYDRTDSRHEKAFGAFDGVFRDFSVLGDWKDQSFNAGSMELINQDSPKDSKWRPDSSFDPTNRLGPIGRTDKTCCYPSLVVEDHWRLHRLRQTIISFQNPTNILGPTRPFRSWVCSSVAPMKSLLLIASRCSSSRGASKIHGSVYWRDAS